MILDDDIIRNCFGNPMTYIATRNFEYLFDCCIILIPIVQNGFQKDQLTPE